MRIARFNHDININWLDVKAVVRLVVAMSVTSHAAIFVAAVTLVSSK